MTPKLWRPPHTHRACNEWLDAHVMHLTADQRGAPRARAPPPPPPAAALLVDPCAACAQGALLARLFESGPCTRGLLRADPGLAHVYHSLGFNSALRDPDAAASMNRLSEVRGPAGAHTSYPSRSRPGTALRLAASLPRPACSRFPHLLSWLTLGFCSEPPVKSWRR